MPLNPYLRPQDTITQILRNTATPAVARRNPLVIGPQYDIFLNDGRDVSKHDFLAAGDILAYEDGDGDAINLSNLLPHAASVELYGEDLEALVATFAQDVWVREGTTNDSLRLSVDNLAGGSINDRHVTLDGRSVAVGDVFAVSITGATAVRRTVVARLGKVTEATAAASLVKTAASSNMPTNASADFEMVGTPSTGWAATAIVTAPAAPFLEYGGTHLKVDTTRQLGEDFTFTITSTDGASGTAEAVVTALTSGLSATIASTNPSLDGTFVFELDAVGYTGVDVKFTKDDDTATAGETFRARVFPIFTAVATSVFTVSGAYTGTIDRRYVIEVTEGASTIAGATLRIYDTSGSEPFTSSAADAVNIPMGTLGLLVDLGAAALYKGAKYYVDAVAEVVSTTEFTGVKLSGPILDSATFDDDGIGGDDDTIDVSIYQPYTGILNASNIASGEAFAATATEVTYEAALGLEESATGRTTVGISPFATGIGSVLLSYKAAVIPAATEGAIAITRADTMAALVGEAHVENWLGRGTYEAFSGNQSQRVYALRTLDDSVEAFTAALRKIRTTDIYYALAVMSETLAVKQLVIAHVEEMSNKYNKNFRRCYVGVDSPGQYTRWGLITGQGVYRQAALASSTVTIRTEDRQYGAFVLADVGSFIQFPELGETDYEITDWVSAYEVVIDIDESTTLTASGFLLKRADTADNTVLFLAEEAAALNSRRCVNVWSDLPTYSPASGESAVLPMKYVAAEIAGLRCALLPQQGLTMTEITSVTAAPSMFTRFSPEQLDTIASYGNMIVSQEAEGGDVFIRHQLTTSITEGALAYEDNVGVIVDTFSYSVKDEFRAYIGKKNATRNTIEDIRVKLLQLATDATKVDLVNEDIGPMVIRFFDEDGKEGAVTVRIDGDLADHILTYTKLRVPLPLNGIDHYVDVETSVDL